MWQVQAVRLMTELSADRKKDKNKKNVQAEFVPPGSESFRKTRESLTTWVSFFAIFWHQLAATFMLAISSLHPHSFVSFSRVILGRQKGGHGPRRPYWKSVETGDKNAIDFFVVCSLFVNQVICTECFGKNRSSRIQRCGSFSEWVCPQIMFLESLPNQRSSCSFSRDINWAMYEFKHAKTLRNSWVWFSININVFRLFTFWSHFLAQLV